MTTSKSKAQKIKRDPDLPMSARVPGGMNEAMVKGCLVTESDLDHGTVAQYGWGFAIKALIAIRGGNYSLDDLRGGSVETPEVDTSTTSPALVAEAEAETEAEAEDDYDFDDLAEFDDLPAGTEVFVPEAGKTYSVDSTDWIDDLDDASIPAHDPTPLFIGMPGTKDYIFDGHAGAGPSGAERWMACTASLGASRQFLETLTPNQQTEYAKAGTAARQGTTAHSAAESEARLMLGQITEGEHNNNLLDLTLTPDVEDEAYSEEMGEYIVEYGDLVKQYHQNGHEVIIEMRVTTAVELTTVTKGVRDVHEITGSADFVAKPTKQDNVLTVGDLKYGKGKEVKADDNPQTKTYALGVLGELAEEGVDVFAIERVDLIIVQPRLGGIKVCSTTVDELLDWRDDVLAPALTEALAGLKGGAQFVPGEVQCQWCPARGGCAALAEARMDAAVDLFDVIVESEFEGEPFPETHILSDERLGQLYSQIEGLTKIKDDLKAEVQRRLHRGGAVPGFQLVNYTPRSTWKDAALDALSHATFDEDMISEEVINKLWQSKLLSPTQALKALGTGSEGAAKVLEDLIDRPEKRPIVAPEGDRRKTWEGKPPESMFDDETGE